MFDFQKKFSNPSLHPDAMLASIPDDRIGVLEYTSTVDGRRHVFDLLSTFDDGFTYWGFCRTTNRLCVIDVSYSDEADGQIGSIKIV